ncbi:MAG TPA: polysaccharide biosynthesis/export family protein [Xanthobacteraceae bacterium]|nr:polysaccharide biosynthesis/export family protein [Xanthobacteraceae bacterium]
MKSWHDFLARFTRLAMVIPLLLVTACAGTPPPASNAVPPEGGVDSYTLGTGDKLRITVFNEPNLSGEFDIDSAGIVALPLVGNVKAAGITQRDLEQQITAKLAGGYMRDPRVNVEVLIYRPFYILGEVTRPGEYPYRNGMNVMGAIAVAGGFTYRGNDKTIYIRRAGQTDERSYPLTTTTVVLPGDILRVPERMF